MPKEKGVVARLVTLVRPLLPEDWFSEAGERFRETTGKISHFTKEQHITPSEVAEEAVSLGRRRLEGEADEKRSKAAREFAAAENLNIEAEQKRRTLESQARQQEAIADEAEEQAKLTRAKRIEAELELVEKFRKLGLILTEEDGEMKIEKAPEDFDSQGLTRRMIDDGSSDSEQD